MLDIKFDHQSVTGYVREINEDSFAVMRGSNHWGALAVVCDGMGGAAGGEIASRIGCETFYDLPIYRDGIKPFNAGSNRKRLERLIQLANTNIRQFAHQHPKYEGMGTTVSALLFLEDKIVVAHVGDSRIYRLRDGKLKRLTKDQTLLEHLVTTGQLAPEKAFGHPSGHILMKAVGATPQLNGIHTLVDDLVAGDLFLTCSDGLSDLVRDEEIQEVLAKNPFNCICENLVGMALARGGRDNITVIAAAVADMAQRYHAA